MSAIPKQTNLEPGPYDAKWGVANTRAMDTSTPEPTEADLWRHVAEAQTRLIDRLVTARMVERVRAEQAEKRVAAQAEHDRRIERALDEREHSLRMVRVALRKGGTFRADIEDNDVALADAVLELVKRARRKARRR